jgi:undecaprenyl-diphosphatase
MFVTRFDHLDSIEIETVRRQTRFMEIEVLRWFVFWLNRLSNGMLYPIVAALIFLTFGRAVAAALIVAAVAVGAAHLCYPFLKSRFARNRPFVRDPAIPSLLKPLDRYSFPSGHAMTATAAFAPLCTVLPTLTLAATAGALLIGWGRLAAGHHYPTDILAGLLLGGAFAAPGVFWLLA